MLSWQQASLCLGGTRTHTDARTHAGTRRPLRRALRRDAPQANCHGNPRGSFHSPPHRFPRAPPGAAANRLVRVPERAIKPEPGGARRRRARPALQGEREKESSNLARIFAPRPEHAECQKHASPPACAVPLPGLAAPPSPGSGRAHSSRVPGLRCAGVIGGAGTGEKVGGLLVPPASLHL